MRLRAGLLLSVFGLGSVVYAADEVARPAPLARELACRTSSRWVHVPAGVVPMGEDGDDRPGRPTHVPEFWIRDHEVTNGEFARFVTATGYVTQAEREGRSAIFRPPSQGEGTDLASVTWWRFQAGANWRHPDGAGSDLEGRAWLPVVHVTFEDAAAYARWEGSELPDATQWERAARGEQLKPRNPLRWAFADDETPVANTWQGVFPVADTGQDHYRGIAPAGCFPANGLGLYDMIGNVWEWTSSDASAGPGQRLLKGGSYLCALNYCANFRAAAYQAQDHDLGASHIGFRTVRRRAPTA